ncbi:hypothetical protein [Phaeobacter sp.]|uniref:hypothetical protein n=1 Tax=Phaeobacter sp. TaxID=1902409 RepID=UPI0025EB3B85|nr:hypothetical protein [Phaeobacter sp.]
MIVIGAVLFGAIFGALSAKKRGGNLADMLQYGTVLAMILGVAGLLITIFIHRALAI